jgi:hypothetical protein
MNEALELVFNPRRSVSDVDSYVKSASIEALAFKGTSVIVVPITKGLKPLFG